MEVSSIKEICSHFPEIGEIRTIEFIPYGHINETYKIETDKRDYIFQKVNRHVFRDAEGLMRNISAVTEHLRKKIIASGGDPERETLALIKTDDSKDFYIDGNNLYRIYYYITDSVCYQSAEKEGLFGEAGASFGRFQKLLSDFDASILKETLPDFHNTAKRYENFQKSVEADTAGRASTVTEEISFFNTRSEYYSLIADALEKGEIPTRVTHNDTKLNNILFDRNTGKGICVIDLDTVMAGSLLYDFGDSIRFGASSAKEDERDISRVHPMPELYEEYAKSFLSELKDDITENEAKLLHDGAIMMTLECGMRFLTDYLDGDIYFRTEYTDHNLVRARTQMKLARIMEEKRSEFEAIIKKYI